MTKKMNKQINLQDESHDWLGDAAENYIRYVFAREGFRVFAGSKWGADLAVYYANEPSQWWRIEIRSTDRNRPPTKKPKSKLKRIADLVVEVRFNDKDTVGHEIRLRIYWVEEGVTDKNWYVISPTHKGEKGNEVHFTIDSEDIYSFLKKKVISRHKKR